MARAYTSTSRISERKRAVAMLRRMIRDMPQTNEVVELEDRLEMSMEENRRLRIENAKMRLSTAKMMLRMRLAARVKNKEPSE